MEEAKPHFRGDDLLALNLNIEVCLSIPPLLNIEIYLLSSYQDFGPVVYLP